MDKCKKNKCCSSPWCNCKEKPVRCAMTGAAGQLCYSLIYMVARGEVFGKDRPVILKLHDEASKIGIVEGVKMELEDGLFPLLTQIVVSSDLDHIFFNVTVAFLIGAKPRQEGQERKELLADNIKIFKENGEALNRSADRDVKVLIVGNPVNTNALICAQYAPLISSDNFSALTRLDQNRATALISKRLRVPSEVVKNVIVWGNHSPSIYTDISNSFYTIGPSTKSVIETINDENYVNKTLLEHVQKRGAAIIATRKKSSSMSAARAVVDHMKDWLFGTNPGEYVSMGVLSDGSYEIPEGIMFSFPVVINNGDWEIVRDLKLSDLANEYIQRSLEELLVEKEEALAIVTKEE